MRAKSFSNIFKEKKEKKSHDRSCAIAPRGHSSLGNSRGHDNVNGTLDRLVQSSWAIQKEGEGLSEDRFCSKMTVGGFRSVRCLESVSNASTYICLSLILDY